MIIMASSKSNNSSDQIYDPYRREWVKKTPEEVIRQQWLYRMVDELGYPFSLLAIEKELKNLPHLLSAKGTQLPKRRIDIVVFAKGIHTDYPFYPLLLVECKAVPLTPAFARQVIGYNESVGAPYVAVANADKILLGQFDSQAGMYQFNEGLQSYQILMESLKR